MRGLRDSNVVVFLHSMAGLFGVLIKLRIWPLSVKQILIVDTCAYSQRVEIGFPKAGGSNIASVFANVERGRFLYPMLKVVYLFNLANL